MTTRYPQPSVLAPTGSLARRRHPQSQRIGANVAALPNDDDGLPLAPAY